MANVVVAGAYATDVVASQKVFYGEQLPFGYQIMLVLSTQIIGFSFGGMVRRFLVWPSTLTSKTTANETSNACVFWKSGWRFDSFGKGSSPIHMYQHMMFDIKDKARTLR
jgi:hypothetical protein